MMYYCLVKIKKDRVSIVTILQIKYQVFQNLILELYLFIYHVVPRKKLYTYLLFYYVASKLELYIFA